MSHAAQPPDFDEIARELSPPLLRYFRRYAGDPTVADDLLQETLIRIARGLPGFTGRASIKSWAFAIATRVAADHFRAPERQRQSVPMDEAPDLATGDPELDQRLVIDEMNACVRQVIDSLPSDYRAALVLHDLEGLPAGEVARICACSLATAKIRIHRARRRLVAALQQQCEFYRDDDDVFRCDRSS
jgi:RNA polymerase sigma-70 factor (ECF subfamily)